MHGKLIKSIKRTSPIERFITHLSAAKTGFDVFKCLKDIKDQFGYDYFSVVSDPDSNSLSFKNRILLTNWSPDLVEFLSENASLSETVFSEMPRKTVIPEHIDFRTPGKSIDEQEILNAYLNNGHSTMCFIPLISNINCTGYVSFSGSREFPNYEETMELAFVCLHMHQNAMRIFPRPHQSTADFNPRQKEILKALAEGMTHIEIAEQLGLSATTINFHLQKAMAMLGCKTRYQLIAKALRCQLIK